jgi:hypothetical protein
MVFRVFSDRGQGIARCLPVVGLLFIRIISCCYEYSKSGLRECEGVVTRKKRPKLSDL